MNSEVKDIGLSTEQVLWNWWYQSVLIVNDFEETFSSKRWVTRHQTDLVGKHLLPIMVFICLSYFWLKMVVNKENIMMQGLHICPAELRILKLQTTWVLISLSRHGQVCLMRLRFETYFSHHPAISSSGIEKTHKRIPGWSVLIMEPISLEQTSN